MIPSFSIGLAPMEGVTTLPMRAWFALLSRPAQVGTPFLRVTNTFPLQQLPTAFAPELFELKSFVPYQVLPQLMAVSSDDFVRTAQLFANQSAIIELNCGCPAPTCSGKGAGSGLLKDPQAFHQLVEQLTRHLGQGRFAIKMRTGFHHADEFSQLISGLTELPLARLTVHGRTRQEAYRGKAKWELIGQAASACRAPVIASGDLVEYGSFVEILKITPSLSGALVGRGALRNPWIFEEIRTQKSVAISLKTLKYALASLALLHELYFRDVEANFNLTPSSKGLFALIKEGLLANVCGTDENEWEHLFSSLALACGHRYPNLEDMETGPVTLGRHKMLWNYLRSSLPLTFRTPNLMRTAKLGDFFRGLSIYSDLQGNSDAPSLLLQHDPTCDWMYAGEARPK